MKNFTCKINNKVGRFQKIIKQGTFIRDLRREECIKVYEYVIVNILFQICF